jgi:tRNA/rRNA methyltransferase
LVIVLIQPRNPLNIGAVARAMTNFGFADLRLVAPYDLAFREAQSAVRARDVLARATVFPDLAAAIADCRFVAGTVSPGHRQLHLPLERLEPAARILRGQPKPAAILFGSEKFGLSNEDLSYCELILTIPTCGSQESMNLGQAVAVVLYELIRDATIPLWPSPVAVPASVDQLSRLEQGLLEALDRSGYINPVVANSTTVKIRRLLKKLGLSSRDATVWSGMLRQILWRLRR